MQKMLEGPKGDKVYYRRGRQQYRIDNSEER